MASNRLIPQQLGTAAVFSAAAVTKSDTVDLPDYSNRGLYVGATGDVKVDMVGGGTVTFVGVPTGVILPIVARRVYSTGTTAASMIALY